MEQKVRFIPSLKYNDANKAIQWLEQAFGFEAQAVYHSENGKVAHAQLVYEGNMIMVGSTDNGTPFGKLIKQPEEIGGFSTQSLYVIIDGDKIDAHYQKAKSQGAKIALELKKEDYGGKGYSCFDIEGHLWNFGSYDPWQDPQ